MKITQQITGEIKNAMLSKDKDRLDALRAIKTALTLEMTNKGAGAQLSDDEEIKILQKLVKQRKESAEIYRSQGREDLAETEIKQAQIIEEFLPAQLDDNQIKSELQKIIEEIGATSAKDFGKVMGVATKKLAGRAEGKKISEILKTLLS
ncbi:MAG: aspartyl-tRNA amidotransferase subunit B [Vicingaceae bacterium]|nr:MAG: aspartyl-tRNA amidotransferase subunit B [Vicingaceae bacterium]